MTLTERVVVFSGLAIAIGLGLSGQFAGSAAVAGPAETRTPGAAPEFKLATVDALAIIARMLESDQYKQANAAHAEKFDTDLRGMLKELEDLRTRALGAAEGSDQRRALESEFVQKNQKFEESRATAQQSVEEFNTSQVAEAYRLVVEAANALAQTGGYTHVIVTRGDQVKIASKSVAGAVQEILARPVIRGVPSDDLTETVIKQFKLENVALPGETPAAPAAEAPAQPK